MKRFLFKYIVLFLAISTPLTGGVIFWTSFKSGSAQSAIASTTELKTGMVDPKNGKKIKYWVAPMDPTYIRNEPGKSPMGMDLVPRYEEEDGSGESESAIRVDPTTVQNMGVRLASVQRKELTKTIRAFGNITYDESRLYTVNTKFDGWIEKLAINHIGQNVTKGQPLFEIYSPDLVTAQEEYLLALRQARRVADSPNTQVRENAERLLEASRTRLQYWDISEEQIQRIEQTGKASKTITVYSPATGVVLKKDAYDGHFVKAGQHQFEIADLSKVWVDVEVYEFEMPWVRKGMAATMDLPYVPGKSFQGQVLYVYPYLSEKTRTVRLRLEFSNKDFKLKPDMYANIQLEGAIANAGLVVPQEAVIDSGTRKVVFVAKGKGRFEPREIQLGVEVNDGEFHVLTGLQDGEQVVTSAQFMLDSESRLREAIQKMLDVRGEKTAATDDDLDMSGLSMTAEEKPQMSGHGDM